MSFPLALLLVQVGALPAATPCPPAPSRDERMAAFHQHKVGALMKALSPWSRLKLPTPEEASQAKPSAQALVEAYGLPPEAAKAFLEWLLWIEPEREKPWGHSAQNLAGGRGCLEQAVRGAPGNLAPFASVLELLPQSEETRAALVDALRLAPDERATGIKLLAATVSDWRPLLATHLVSRHPEALAHVLEALGTEAVGAHWLPFLESAWRALPADAKNEALRQRVTEQLLRALLEESLPIEAARVYSAMPSKARADFLAAKWTVRAPVPLMLGKSAPRASPPPDLRAELGVSLLAAGELPAAREVFASFSAVPLRAGDPRLPDEGCGAARSLILGGRLGAAKVDPFALFTLLRRCNLREPFPTVALPLLSGRYQKALAAPAVIGTRDGVGDYDLFKISKPFDLSFSAPALASLTAASVEEQKRRATAWPKGSPADAEPASPTGGSALIARQLAATPPTLFEERPAAECDRALAGVVKAKPANLPKGFLPVSAAKRGSGAVVLALSQKLDPVGEVSAGAYWLLEPKHAPLYLGLRQYRPYEVPASSVPALSGGRLHLRVNVRELDERSITFPPVGLATRRKADGVCLRAKLTDLRRDADHDGLTDLTEARMLTDPHAADSDGDGLNDAQDALPQVSSQGKKTIEGQVLEAFLIHLLWSDQRMPAIVEGLHKPGVPGHHAQRAFEDPAVTFLDAAPETLVGVDLPMRVVPLSGAPLEKAQKRFGAFYPMSVWVTPDDAGARAYIEWNEGWRGGSAQGTRKGDHWEFVSLGDWIT